MSNTIDQFISNVVDKPHVFFTSNQKVADSALEMAKHFYNNVKKVEQVQLSPFTELLTEGFDNDQIWEEIAAQNEPFLNYAKQTLKSLSSKKSPQKHQQQAFSEEDDEDSISGQSMDLDESQDEDMESVEQDVESDQQEDSENDIQEEEEEEEKEDDIEEKAPKKTSEVDDEFFNLDQFNKWTEEQEELDMMSDREDQDDFDFDRDLGEEEDSDDEENDEDATMAAAEMTFDDFFGKKPRQISKKSSESEKRVQFEDEEEEEQSSDEEEDEQSENDEEEQSDEEGSVRDLFAEDEDEEPTGDKSTFQKQQERIQEQIEAFEEENVQDKHWTLRGEATANIRPVNSLLEEDLEFEHANKPVPVITQEITNTLEEMIKKRILDNMFDDVERKVDPTLRPFVPSKRVEISDEKSKQSLAEIYEDEYVHKQAGEEKKDVRDEALEKEHEEITEMFKTLCYKLDALSNFHYTPKAAKPEMTIVSNSAAISMEEVIPVNVSDATLLAPEEVYDKKRTETKATSEMSQEERKRLRAQKKKLKRKEKALKEREMKVMQKYNPQIGQKKEKMNAVKELLTQKNVTVIGKDGQQKQFTKK